MSQAFETYFKLLSGSWNLKREISTGETLTGKADFEFISESAFLMCEEGDLILISGAIIPASRNWYWHLSKPQALAITYDEACEQAYHHVLLKYDDNAWIGKAQHLCGSDLYIGEYRFYDNGFEIKQIIKGPSKNYEVISAYSK